MIPRRTRAGLAILTALALLTYWANRNTETGTDASATDIDTRMEYVLDDFQLRYFDAQGQQAMLMTSPRFESDAVTGEGHAESPVVEIHHQGFVWNIIADAARFQEPREEVFLLGAVRLVREGDRPTDRLQIDTAAVTIDVEARTARSLEPMQAQDSAGTLTATGFTVNMTENTFELQQEVRGHYVLP